MVGHDPVWGGFYAPLRGDTYHALDNVHRHRYGWAVKVLWLIRPGWTQPVTLAGHAVGTGQPIWFRTGGIHPRGPVTSVVLDPQNPEIPDVHNWANFPSDLLFPSASCYILTASWSGGSWSIGFGFGK